MLELILRLTSSKWFTPATKSEINENYRNTTEFWKMSAVEYRYIKFTNYCLPFTNALLGAEKLLQIVLHCVLEWKKRRKAEKLHWQFAHVSEERLILEAIGFFVIRSFWIWSKMFVILVQFAWGLEDLFTQLEDWLLEAGLMTLYIRI